VMASSAPASRSQRKRESDSSRVGSDMARCYAKHSSASASALPLTLEKRTP
jgi:hypothetical protein